MNIQIPFKELPKQFYEITVVYFNHENLKNFNINLEELDIDVINDLANFSYTLTINRVTEKAIFFINITSLNQLKLLFAQSLNIHKVSISNITDELLNGEYSNENFWGIIENKIYNNDNLRKNEIDFFLKFVEQNSTVDNILSKISVRGFQNLLKPEVKILELVSNS